MADSKRVNKVTARYEEGVVVLTLYKTNEKLGTLTNAEIGLPTIPEGATKTAFLEQCKDVLIELLKNNGVPGFHFDDQSYQQDNGIPKKLDPSTLAHTAGKLVSEMFEQMITDGVIDKTSVSVVGDIGVTERYKDNYLKYGQCTLSVTVNKDGETMVGTTLVEVKSGQLCKPKAITFGEKTFNIGQKNIAKLFKKEEVAVSEEEKPKKAKKKKRDVEIVEDVAISGDNDITDVTESFM